MKYNKDVDQFQNRGNYIFLQTNFNLLWHNLQTYLVAFSSLIVKDFEAFRYSKCKVYLSKDEALLVSYLGQQPLFAIFYVTSYGEYKERENKSFLFYKFML